MRSHLLLIGTPRALAALSLFAALALPGAALGAPTPQRSRPPVTALGTLFQLQGPGGCVVDRSRRGRSGCTRVRALQGPAPFLGSEAVAISPDGRNVYVASSRSSAIAIFTRSARTGKLTQRAGPAGCIAVNGAGGCARGLALGAPNSVAVSPDGKSVYATSLAGNAVDSFRRDPATGALSQAIEGSGCVADIATTGCTTGRALLGPDVVTVSPDNRNVYVGSFKGNSIAVFARDSATGTLTQPAGTSGCIVSAPIAGCATGVALGSPEGMAISPDGANVYVAAALSSALDVFNRNSSTGALVQGAGAAGCLVASPLSGCAIGVQLGGADAVAVSPDGGSVYVTSVLSNSLTTFARAPMTGQLTQLTGTSACAVYLVAVGCSLARAFSAPEGLTVSPDGANVYTTAFASGAVGVFIRDGETGSVIQQPRQIGCATTGATPDCMPARALSGASSVAVSPDGRYLYAAAFESNAVAVFRRIAASGHGAG
jgi:DNA-binding beta-propeller fold protein YncE